MSYKKVLEKTSLKEFKDMYFSKLSYEGIAIKLGLHTRQVSAAARVCRNKYKWPARVNRVSTGPNKFLSMSEEELLEEIRYYKTKDGSPNQLEYAVKKYFGSWSKGTEAALGKLNYGGTMLPNKATLVYLIEFDNFIKLGITQQFLENRLRKFKNFKLLDYVEVDLDTAKQVEYDAKIKLTPFKEVPNFMISNGSSECYEKPVELEFDKSLKSLFPYLKHFY